MLARDIHSSFLQKSVNYRHKKFYNIDPWSHCDPLNLWFMLFSERLGAVVAYQSGQGENDGESDASGSKDDATGTVAGQRG